MKKILVVCTGNSCRSIIAEALINSFLKGYHADSCGANPSYKVHPNAKKILQENNIWKETYHSKHIDSITLEKYDLIVTVCDNAKESCVMLPSTLKHLHMNFEDPDKKPYEMFIKTYHDIKTKLLPAIQKELQ